MPAILLFLVLSAGRAEAQFAVCNESLDVVNVAVGLEAGNDFETQGWWTVATNQCVDVVKEKLTSRFVYVFATDVFRHPLMEGAIEMCVAERGFSIKGTKDCWQRGQISAKFIEVDTKAVERWTLFIRPEDGT